MRSSLRTWALWVSKHQDRILTCQKYCTSYSGVHCSSKFRSARAGWTPGNMYTPRQHSIAFSHFILSLCPFYFLLSLYCLTLEWDDIHSLIRAEQPHILNTMAGNAMCRLLIDTEEQTPRRQMEPRQKSGRYDHKRKSIKVTRSLAREGALW